MIYGPVVTAAAPPSDADLENARTSWTATNWDDHFRALGMPPGGRARYKSSSAKAKPTTTPHNDVIKVALFALAKGRCWWQGGSCRSRAVPPRDAEIDHLIPQAATVLELRSAMTSSLSQRSFFDVHDPGNLAYICGPCNRAKSDNVPDFPAAQEERRKAEAQRDELIILVDKWYATLDIESSGLGLATMDVSDPDVQEMYTEFLTDMILNLYAVRGGTGLLIDYNEVSLETPLYKISLGPSDEAIEAEVESRAEMAADEVRWESRDGL